MIRSALIPRLVASPLYRSSVSASPFSRITPLCSAQPLALTRSQSTSTSDKTIAKPAVAPSFLWKGFHMTSYGLLALIPTGILLAPTASYPVDMLLNVLLPAHMFFGKFFLKRNQHNLTS